MPSKFKAALVLALAAWAVLAGCEQKLPDKNEQKSVNPAGYPLRLSDVEGWRNVHVKHVTLDGMPVCDVLFPENFGIAEEEREYLEYLVSQDSGIQGDLNCYVFPNNAYKALDQLLHLSIEKQDVNAARIILNKGSKEMPFGLDGEVAESYLESYLMPLLEKFEKLDLVLDKSSEDSAVKSICSNLEWRIDVHDSGFVGRVHVLADRLRARGLKSLASAIEGCEKSGGERP
ncbi:MAG TPA: hypothetical protein VFX02_03425 [Gammaproteobacteria bacterium]|nr:hypothetical protein [Gammaproteobacteria bacterium]